jgi:hypothetical protein
VATVCMLSRGGQVVSGIEEDSCYAINREFMERMAAQAAEQAAS